MKFLIFFLCIFFQILLSNGVPTLPPVETITSKEISKTEVLLPETNIDENKFNESVPQVNYGQQCSFTFTPDRTTHRVSPMSRENDIYDKIVGSYVLVEQQLKKLDSIENMLSKNDVIFQEKIELFKHLLLETTAKCENIESKMSMKFEKKNEEVSSMSIKNLEQTIKENFDELKSKMSFDKYLETHLSASNQKTSHVVCKPEEDFPKDCFELYYIKGIRSSGVYKIKPLIKVFDVYCDMETDGGGWVVIQNRYNGSVNFYRNWDNYKVGFGNIEANSEFWLGLENIHQLTYNQVSKMRIELQDFNETSSFEIYTNFAVGSEIQGYPLDSIGTFSGTAGNALQTHVGQKFSTFDNDNDNYPGNCAIMFTGAWWYNTCHSSNLNGQYLTGQIDKNLENSGIVWNTFRTGMHSLKKSKMMVRRSI